MAQSKLPASEEIMDRYRAGESLTAIGKEYGVSGAAVSIRLRNQGYDPAAEKAPGAIDIAQAVADYRAGLSIVECAQRQNVSKTRMHTALHEAGIEMRATGYSGRPRKYTEPDKIVSLYKDGKSISHIARVMEANPHTIRRVLYREGVYDPNRDSRRISQDTEDRVVERLLNGESRYAASRQEAISRETIDRIINRRGLLRREDGTWCLPEDRAA